MEPVETGLRWIHERQLHPFGTCHPGSKKTISQQQKVHSRKIFGKRGRTSNIFSGENILRTRRKGRAKWLQIYGLVLLGEDLSMTISINFLCIRNLWFVYYGQNGPSCSSSRLLPCEREKLLPQITACTVLYTSKTQIANKSLLQIVLMGKLLIKKFF